MFMVKPRLVIIDEEATLLRMYQRMIGRDFEIEVFTDPRVALACIVRGGVDVILCDHQLGAMSGQDVYEALPVADQARVVMCSGAPPSTDDAFAMALRERYFVKMRPIDELVTLLIEVAEASAPTMRSTAA